MKKRFTFSALLLAMIFTFPFNNIFAESSQDQVEKSLPRLLGATNEGMDFVLSFIPAWVENGTPSMGDPGIRLYISSAAKANVRVQVPSKGFEKVITTVSNQTSEVYIPYDIAQVAAKRTDRDIPDPAQVYPGGAVIVTSDAPIVCYGMVRYPYTSDGYLALPVSSLGKEYVVASYNGPTDDPDPSGQYLTSYTAIVGAYDNTQVTFTYGGNANGRVETSDGKKLTPGQSETKTLNRGDVWLIPARGNKPDITGSYVVADKPVACVSGNFCAYIPVNKAACDHIIEQDIPTNLWGTKYFVTPIIGRKKNSPIRLFAGKDNVTIFKDSLSNQVVTIPKKFGPEKEGWVEIRSAEGLPVPVTLFSNDRFNVVQYNPGMQDDNIEIGSDPFQFNLVSVEQFRNYVAFNTPGVLNGLKFKYNYINLVYLATPDGKIPDDVEFGTYTPGNNDLTWSKLSEQFGTDPGLKFMDPTNSSPDRSYYCKQIKLPEDGVYHIRAVDKFMAYAYGYSDFDSYGFPVALLTKDYSKNDTIMPMLSYSIDANGNVSDPSNGSSPKAYVKDMPEDPKRRSNLGVIYFNKELSENYAFNYTPFIAGDNNYAEWSLKVIDPAKNSRAVITFTDRAGNDTTIVISRALYKPSIVPKAKNISVIDSGGKSEYIFKLRNASSAETVLIPKIALKSGKNFKLSYDFDPYVPLNPDEERDIKITFTAGEIGEYVDSIGVGDDNNFRYLGFISASVGAPVLETENADFPNTQLNVKSEPKEIKITNKGNTGLAITGFQGPLSSSFITELESMEVSEDNPLYLSPGNSFTFKVWFKPNEIKTYKDSIVVLSNSTSGDGVCYLTGTTKSAPVITVADNNFYECPINTTKDTTVVIKNAGQTPLSIVGYTEPTTQFFTTNLNELNISENSPKILQPNEQFSFRLSFQPTQKRIYTDSVTFISDAGGDSDPVCHILGQGVDNNSAVEVGFISIKSSVQPNPVGSLGGALEFETGADGAVEVSIYDATGRQIAVLLKEWKPAGNHSLRIPVETLTSGAYTYRIVAEKNTTVGNFVITK